MKLDCNPNHDVAELKFGAHQRHIIMRHDHASLCGAIDRGLELAYVGAWDSGAAPTCPECRRQFQKILVTNGFADPPKPGMHEYAFDATFVAAIRVKAPNEEEARRLLAKIDTVDAQLGYWEYGDPITCEISLDTDREAHLFQLDGKDLL